MTLRRATGIEIVRTGFGIFARFDVREGGRTWFRLHQRAHRRASAVVEDQGAATLGADGPRTLWWTADGLFWDDEGLDAEAVALLAWDRRRRQDARIDRLRKVRAAEEAVAGHHRERIADDVRLHVWERDGGRCVRCERDDDLQFDHVIPVSRGGGNAAENIQILCGSCNRSKGDALA